MSPSYPLQSTPDFGSYYGVIAVNNVPGDGGGACYIGQQSMTINNKTYPLACVWFAPNALYTAFAAHEISHGFGLNHSYDNSQKICAINAKPGEYCDPWDIMSASVTYQFTEQNWPIWENISTGGPGMSTPNLLRMGWMPTANHGTFQIGGGEQPFNLRALSHAQPGVPLVVFLDLSQVPFFDAFYTVEYRQGDGWDLGFVTSPSAPVTARLQGGAVLVHRWGLAGEPASTLIETPSRGALVAGDTLNLTSSLGLLYHVTVKSIDTINGFATVSIGPGSG